jgi:uncharacterized protein YndB with AHSA1/START domain/DNA-binding transcriptional ArsR family regulator
VKAARQPDRVSRPVATARRPARLDDVFAALSDPIRRAIIAQLAGGACSVSRLGASFAVSAPAISKHLAVLERSGLIVRWKVGRVHFCRLVADPLARAGAWIQQHQVFWERQFDALAGYLDRGGSHVQSATAEPERIGIKLQRTFRASPERVFRAWTQPTALREWWCPPGWVAGKINFDLRVGGTYSIAMSRAGSAGSGVSVRGQFLEVRPPERLVYTWRWEGAFAEMPETLVTLELRGSDHETLLTLHHDNFADPGLRQQHRSGWMAACDRLDRLVTPPAVLPDRAAAL